MNPLYETKGLAREYAPLAVNLFKGCSGGCRYCYAPGVLRTDRESFLKVCEKKTVLASLKGQLTRHPLPPTAGPVLLCFTCDPYPRLGWRDIDLSITRQAIEILGEAGLPIRILTKNPSLAYNDVVRMVEHKVEVGVSMVWQDDELRQQWEPHTDPVGDRLEYLRLFKEAGCRTWVSIEPVIVPKEAVRVMVYLKGLADVVWIGKINHHPDLERRIDWKLFRQLAEERGRQLGLDVRFKSSLQFQKEEAP